MHAGKDAPRFLRSKLHLVDLAGLFTAAGLYVLNTLASSIQSNLTSKQVHICDKGPPCKCHKW